MCVLYTGHLLSNIFTFKFHFVSFDRFILGLYILQFHIFPTRNVLQNKW